MEGGFCPRVHRQFYMSEGNDIEKLFVRTLYVGRSPAAMALNGSIVSVVVTSNKMIRAGSTLGTSMSHLSDVSVTRRESLPMFAHTVYAFLQFHRSICKGYTPLLSCGSVRPVSIPSLNWL